MTVCLIIENPDQSEQEARQVLELVRKSGPVPPKGARLMFAGSADPGTRIISVWDSQEPIERFFTERLGPAMTEIGVSHAGAKRTLFELHTLVAGDLTAGVK
jgi:hypothetical protein